MAYATKEDVKAMFRDFHEGSDPAVSDADLDLYITNTTSIINAKIGTLYVLPINDTDNPESFAILKQLQMYKVACMVDDILNNYAEADKKPSWCKSFKMLMAELVPPKNDDCKQCEPTMKLPDAEYIGTPTQKNRISVGPTTGTIFKKGADNW